MRLFLPLSIIAGLLLTGFILLGISIDENTAIEESIVVEAPVALVWNEIISFDQHHKWYKSIEALYNYNNSARQIRYNFDKQTLMASQQVRIRENALTVDFIKIGQEEYSELKNIGGTLQIISLADGNTQVNWKITYTAPNISLRMISRFSLDEKIRSLIKENLRSFKNYIES